MKKMIYFYYIILSILLMSFSSANAAPESHKLFFNGSEITPSLPIYRENNWMYMSIRSVSEILNVNLKWNDENKTAIINYDNNEITIPLQEPIKVNESARFVRKTVYNDRIMIEANDLDDLFDGVIDLHVHYYNDNIYIAKDNSLKKVKEKGELTIGRTKNKNDFSTEFNTTLAQETADRMGLKLTIKEYENGDEIDALNAGKIDVIWNDMIDNEDQEETFLLFYPYVKENQEETFIYSYPYISDGFALVAKNDCNIKMINELEQAKLGCLDSYYNNIINSKEFINEKIKQNLKKYNSQEQMLKALDIGKIDAFFAKKLNIQYQIIKNSNKYKLLPFLYNKQDYSITFRKEDITLRDTIDDIINEIKKDNTYSNIVDKYFGNENIGNIYFNSDKLIYNGYSYINHGLTTSNNWKILKEQRIGESNITSFAMYEYETGFFEAANSNGIVLRFHPAENELDFLFIREDYAIPEITSETISKIGFFPYNSFDYKYFNYYFINLGKYTTDKSIIKELIYCMNNGEIVQNNTLYSPKDSLLLYSDMLPGCGYYIDIEKHENEYILTFNEKSVKISEELVNKLKTENSL